MCLTVKFMGLNVTSDRNINKTNVPSAAGASAEAHAEQKLPSRIFMGLEAVYAQAHESERKQA